MDNYSGPGRRKPFPLQAVIQIFVGVLYLGLAAYIILTKSFVSQKLDPKIAYGVGALLLAYGVFRVWRGIKMYQQVRDAS